MPRKASSSTIEPLEYGLESLSELDTLVEAVLWGFAWVHNSHDSLSGAAWVEFVQRTRMPFSLRWRFDFAMEQTATQARRGFPLFFRMATVSIAATLEASVRDFALRWLYDHSAAWQTDAVRRIERPVADFVRMSRRERTEALLLALEQSLRSSSSGKRARPGVEPFQRLLGAIGVAPELTMETAHGVNELVAVRNQLLHHGGRIDARFKELCPELAKRRRSITITDEMLNTYFDASRQYLEAIGDRARSVASIEDG